MILDGLNNGLLFYVSTFFHAFNGNFVFYNCSAVLHLAETLEIAFSEVSSDNLPPESDNTSCYWGGF